LPLRDPAATGGSKFVFSDLGIVGISWRSNAVEGLDGYALPTGAEDVALRAFAERNKLKELAYLSTCNRVELIFSRAPGASRDIRPETYALLTGHLPVPGVAERRLKAWEGEGACEHLFLVAAGLDSAAIGEAEIAGQVRRCHENALDLGLSGPRLELLFEEALKIAAQVRGETRLGQGRVSLAEIAVDSIRERLARTGGRVALIGVSPMTERAARSLAKAGVELLVVNRSEDKARALAAEFGTAHSSLDAFRSEPPGVEAILSATGSAEPILTEPVLERLATRVPSGQPLMLIDMAVPADIDPDACTKLGLTRIGMDQIVAATERNRAARLDEAAQARELVDDALARLHDRFAERIYGPLFGALQQRYRRTAEEGVNRLLKKELKGLGDAEREAIATWSQVLARRFAHIPCLGLRGLLHDGPEGALDAFLSGLDPEFADELRAAVERGGDQSGSRHP
jgi:glutamyl-tRNA reductase